MVIVLSDEKKIKVGLSLEEEMIFKCDLGQIKMQDLYIDEKNKREAEKIGPNPSRLLALAVLGCLAASFTFCMSKKDLKVGDLDGKAEVILKRSNKGFWRVKRINVTINPKIDDPIMRKRADQCRKMFEQYCIVTQSVRNGIEVNVDLDY